MTRRTTLRAIVAAAIVITLSALHWSGAPDVPWFGDEAHKISETSFARLVVAGDFRSPMWTNDRVERANPQVGKLVFAAALVLGGDAVPRDLSILDELSRSTNWQTTEPTRRANLHRLRSVRRVSAVCNAISAATLFWIASAASMTGGAAAAIVFAIHPTVDELGSMAVFDPLMTTFFVLTIAAAGRAARTGGRGALIAAAILSALCFQTRLSGLFAWAGAAATIAVARRRRAVADVAILTAVMIAVSFAVNPFYWSLNPVRRFLWQIDDLAVIMTWNHAAIHSLPKRLAFEWRILGGGLFAGIALWLALLAARRAPAMPEALGAFAAALVVMLWLPVPWPRYLEPVIAAFALCSGLAAAAVIALLARRRAR